MSVFTESELYALGLLEKKLEREMYKYNFFTRFTAQFSEDHSKAPQDPTMPPVAPIVIKRGFASAGQREMTVPMLRNLTDPEKYGDVRLKGNTEAQSLIYAKVFINQRRNGVNPPSGMSNQYVKPLKLYAQSRQQLAEKIGRWTEVNIVRSIYEKWSYNVTSAKANGGFGEQAIQHPNIFTADAGQVAWSANNSTYISNIHTARSNLLAGASDDIMSARALRNFRTACNKLEIPYIMINGMAVRPLLIHENQFLQLTNDSEYISAQENANVRHAMKNPLFHGASGLYAGFVIFVREFSVFGLDTTSSTATWGATNPLQAVDTYPVKGAICFSNSAICGGWAHGPEFTTDDDDHMNYREVGVRVIDGFARADYVDSFSSGSETVNVNKSSAILLTYSPDSWN